MNPRKRLWWKNKARAANVAIALNTTEEKTTKDVVAEVKASVAAETPTTNVKKPVTTSKKVKTKQATK